MAYNQTAPAFLMEVKENSYNTQFLVGDQITFAFAEASRQLKGTVMKKYTHSCLVDISQDSTLSETEITAYNGKVIVNYKWIQGVDMHDA
ncbi:hypothetical protein NRIC_22600 [Enterococcus florum]|uniref:DUF2187 domain-containing protein n=1 Tax=Enterococcus florum TaxID=2480627 RepID=A0A4V0WPM4_9ENTE|nr:DUF2187 domain-containing protein [Enterococcus florum]GCF94369.1 hypothetical protein NRIC_22600 [Enterococcus florum]